MYKAIINIYFISALFFSVFLFSVSADDIILVENEGITITGTVPTSQQISIVEKEQIENSSASDLADILHETLGLNIVRYGAYGNQTGINLRGFDSKRIAFLIDGIPANSSIDGRFDINQIDINSIERIEVIHGGSDSKYNVSGAFGGVINIITIKKQKKGLRLTASVSNTSVKPGKYRNRSGEMQEPHWEDLFDTQNYSLFAAYGGEAVSVTANFFANRAENHFIFLDRINRLRRKDNNEIWDTGAGASFVWELQDLTKLIYSANFYYSDSNFPMSGFSSRAGNQIDFSAKQSFMIDKPRIFHDDISAEFSFTWRFHKRDYTSPLDLTSIHYQNNLFVINRWNWYAGDLLILRTGADYSCIFLDSNDIGKHNGFNGGFYLTIEYKPVKSFLIIPSSKIVFSSTGSDNYAVIPKLGLLWNVTDNFSVKNNYFRNFKFPDFEELYWNSSAGSNTGGAAYGTGNPNLRPEDGWGADIGLTWKIIESILIECVFFAQSIQNSIHWFSRSGGIWQPENVGEAAIFGGELKTVLDIPVSIWRFKKITTSLSYRYLLSYLLSYGYTFDSNKRIPYNPEHTIYGSLDFSWDSGLLSFTGHYESLRYHDTTNWITLDPVFLLGLKFNQKIGNNLTAFGALRNILNTSYESFYDYPMPGITLTLGLRANLEFK
ncbi:MAG: TonB-dependent receptor [Treponema sp.]|nr:TonB-dependent receptor [Treponema sp.]